jgi:hypothetical protein
VKAVTNPIRSADKATIISGLLYHLILSII